VHHTWTSIDWGVAGYLTIPETSWKAWCNKWLSKGCHLLHTHFTCQGEENYLYIVAQSQKPSSRMGDRTFTTRALDHMANKQRNWGARTPRQLARTMYMTFQKRFVNGWVYISIHLVKCRHSVLFGDLLNVPCPASCLCINQGLLVREILTNDPRNDLMCPLCTHDPYLFISINLGICRHSVALYVSHWMCPLATCLFTYRWWPPHICMIRWVTHV